MLPGMACGDAAAPVEFSNACSLDEGLQFSPSAHTARGRGGDRRGTPCDSQGRLAPVRHQGPLSAFVSSRSGCWRECSGTDSCLQRVVNSSRMGLVCHVAEKPSPAGHWLAGSGSPSRAGILGLEFLEADLIRLFLPCSVLISQENKALVESLQHRPPPKMPQGSKQIPERGQMVAPGDSRGGERSSGVSGQLGSWGSRVADRVGSGSLANCRKSQVCGKPVGCLKKSLKEARIRKMVPARTLRISAQDRSAGKALMCPARWTCSLHGD